MENYLNKILKEYFKESTKIEGFLLSIDALIMYAENELSKSQNNSNSFASLISSYRDLSELSNKMNLHLTGFEYELKHQDFKEDVAIIASRECCFALAQVYEVFESYLKNVLTAFLHSNPYLFDNVNFKHIKTPETEQDFREFVIFTQRQGKNNKKLLWSIRKLSSFYRRHEIENIWRFNLANWFDLISEIRHSIVHSRQDLTDNVKLSIKKNQNKVLFDRYFISDKSFKNGIIYTNRLKTGEHICLFNQFAFLIFKSLSIEANLDIIYY